MPGQLLLQERVFLNRSLYHEAERLYSFRKNALEVTTAAKDALTGQMESMKLTDESSIKVADLVDRLKRVEDENTQLKALLQAMEARLVTLEGGKPAAVAAVAAPAAPAAAAKPADNDDDFDLFGEDDEEESEEKKRITEERLKAYNAKKAKKPAVIAKSSVLLDCKPWDDETDMAAFEAAVRGIQMEGLVWGQSKLIPVAYGVKKLQIGCVIEDDKVSTEALEEQICSFEDYCQSVDIAAFNKL